MLFKKWQQKSLMPKLGFCQECGKEIDPGRDPNFPTARIRCKDCKSVKR